MICGPPRQRSVRRARATDSHRRLDVARDVEVEIAVAVGIEERAPMLQPPAATPATATFSNMRSPRLRNRRSDPSWSRRDRVGRRRRHRPRTHHCPQAARSTPDCFETSSNFHPRGCDEGIAIGDALTRRGELRRGHQIDVEQPITVVVRTARHRRRTIRGCDPWWGLRNTSSTAAAHRRRSHRMWAPLSGSRDVRGRGTHRRGVAAGRGLFGLVWLKLPSNGRPRATSASSCGARLVRGARGRSGSRTRRVECLPMRAR